MNEMLMRQVDFPVADIHQDQNVMHRTGLSLVSRHHSIAIQVSKREAPSVCECLALLRLLLLLLLLLLAAAALNRRIKTGNLATMLMILHA